MVAGLISMETLADEMGYESADSLTPRVPMELLIGKSGPGADGGSAKEKKQKVDSKRKKNKTIQKKAI
jgi:hypothetical protein